MAHTRTSDEQLLIQFVYEAAPDEPDLVEAAARLEKCSTEGVIEYSIPEYKEEGGASKA